ncbi:MAG: DUF983 domain-containing protein [Fulvivirga sp.]|uniref:DUF983 domain-containing protein n=1 Tax=Fulvivirga sp. TaxID=1931237 RepID=UPI0032EEC204
MLKTILTQKCPRCGQGDLFKSSTYNLKHFAEMHTQCAHCNQKFELEPSFYTGAMYVSYALQVAIFTAVIVAYKVLYPQASVTTYILSIIGAIILLVPLTFRLSRSVWIHFFVKRDNSYL